MTTLITTGVVASVPQYDQSGFINVQINGGTELMLYGIYCVSDNEHLKPGDIVNVAVYQNLYKQMIELVSVSDLIIVDTIETLYTSEQYSADKMHSYLTTESRRVFTALNGAADYIINMSFNLETDADEFCPGVSYSSTEQDTDGDVSVYHHSVDNLSASQQKQLYQLINY